MPESQSDNSDDTQEMMPIVNSSFAVPEKPHGSRTWVLATKPGLLDACGPPTLATPALDHHPAGTTRPAPPPTHALNPCRQTQALGQLLLQLML